MLELTYIHHDCFLLRTAKAAFVFDYWLDPTASNTEVPEFLSLLNPDMPLYVFVSHHHKDHFNRCIFAWQKLLPQVHFIISRDAAGACRYMLRQGGTYKGFRPTPESVSVMRPGDDWSDNVLSVRAFGSTDTGNSYLLEVDGRRIFHAGDLNAWMWKDESTPAQVAAAIRDYERCLAPIAEAAPHVDVAMMPVDSRLGSDYWEGAARLVRRIDVAHFFPMHFELADDEEQLRQRRRDAAAFRQYANPDRGEYIALQSPYASFLMP